MSINLNEIQINGLLEAIATSKALSPLTILSICSTEGVSQASMERLIDVVVPSPGQEVCRDESFTTPCDADACTAAKCANCGRYLSEEHLVAWHGIMGAAVCDQECGEMQLNRVFCGTEEQMYEQAYREMLEAKAPRSIDDSSQWVSLEEIEANSAEYQLEVCAPLDLAWDLAHKENAERDQDQAYQDWTRQQLGDKSYQAYSLYCAEMAFEEARGDFGE